MTPQQAHAFAATWGSFMTNGDPGACMYGFDETFRVQSDTHREQCLAWIDKDCIPQVEARPGDYDANERAKLVELRAMIDRQGQTGAEVDLAEFFDGMMNCALWLSIDYERNDDENDDTSFMSNGATIADLRPSFRGEMINDARAFLAACGDLIVDANFTGRADGTIMSRAGHDFWLTRCRHGAGFWDGDWREPAATKLTDAAHTAGEVDLGRDENGQICA